LQRATHLDVLMVPSSSVAITTDGERLACGGFSLGEPVHLGNFEFRTDYFGGLSLPHRRGNEGTVIMGSTHSGASTPYWAMIEDSTEEFLTASSGERVPHCNRNMDGERSSNDKVSPVDVGATARNQ
jgi:hypothetical protein